MTKTEFEEEDLKRAREDERHFGEGHGKGLRVTPYDFEPLDGWTMKWLIYRLKRLMCTHCRQRPPDRLICSQQSCYRRECAIARVWEVELL